MKEYICTICGYVYVGELPDDFRCPICGAGKEAFRLKTEEPAQTAKSEVSKPHLDRELSPMEMSIICSNLARGCEKQYMEEQAKQFSELAEFFRSQEKPMENPDLNELLARIEEDLSSRYPYADGITRSDADRGALRSLVWSEKVTRMLQSLLARYQSEGERMLAGTGVYVCTICGFVFIGDAPPEICPVCKVPAWKFEKQEGRK